MWRWLLALVALGAAGCYRVPDDSCAIRCDLAAADPCPSGLTCGADGLCFAGTACSGRPDGSSVDAPETDAPNLLDGMTCYGSGLVVYCPTVLPPTRVIDVGESLMVETTDPTMHCTEIITVNGTEMCVLAAEALTINGRIRGLGRRPLVLFGRDSITFNGVVDVSAGGAGASACSATSGINSTSPGVSAGGGGGGSFGGSGGRGGSANDNMHAPPSASVTVPLTALRGGCAGGDGGQSSALNGGGTRGLGGGVVVLLSGGPIIVNGGINASGGAGGGGQGINVSAMNTGGGGGGSGGVIWFEAPSVTLQFGSVTLAQGGGGGGGSDGIASGGDGNPAMLTRPMDPGTGGIGSGTNSGNGGSGSSASTLYGEVGGDAASGGSGGGGGGGAGLILVRSTTTTTVGSVYPALMSF